MDGTEILLWLIPLLAITGVVAGVLAGLLGVGGGIVIVPALYHIFSYLEVDSSVRMHLAVGTSLATIIPTSIRSVRAHHQRGGFDAELFKSWAPVMALGVLAGTWSANLADFAVLAGIFGVVALLVALYMGFGNADWRISNGLPTGLASQPLAAFVGAVSAMMGIGGGTLSVPLLSLFGVPIHTAVGTAAGFGMVIAIPGCIGFIIGGWGASGLPPYSLGYVNALGFLLIVPATVLSVPLGAKLAHSLSTSRLRKAFAIFLGITGARMIWDVLTS
jgi:uncharacterized membrane protein YfcA